MGARSIRRRRGLPRAFAAGVRGERWEVLHGGSQRICGEERLVSLVAARAAGKRVGRTNAQ